MDTRERVRLYMAALRATRRAKGLCPRCGLARVTAGENCDPCNGVRRVKRDGGYTVDTGPSTRVA